MSKNETMSLKALQKKRRETVEKIAELERDLEAYDRVIAREIRDSNAEKGEAVAFELQATSPEMTHLETVRKAIESFSDGFTKSDVFQRIYEKFPSSTLGEQDVASILWKMANKWSQLDIEKVGRGGVPSVYRRKPAA